MHETKSRLLGGYLMKLNLDNGDKTLKKIGC